jgi:ketosteroid isomerase-like protein
MRHFFLSFLYLLFYQPTSAQSDSINAQVWKPFIKAFHELNTDAFMALHSKDVSRVLDGDIQNYETYAQNTQRANASMKKDGNTQSLELRFTKRIVKGDRAYETGYYKGTFTPASGAPRHYYGRFAVLLRKENGTWKILMDQDAREDASETTFQAASAME